MYRLVRTKNKKKQKKIRISGGLNIKHKSLVNMCVCIVRFGTVGREVYLYKYIIIYYKMSKIIRETGGLGYTTSK